jgi:hypothetical protein
VYSLGVLLYVLLTGTTPFDKERFQQSSVDEVKRIIREEEPPKPSTRLSTVDAALETLAETHRTDLRTLTQELNGELDWIVMKAIEKDRSRRYESASDFAEDVQRCLDDEPVEACPPSTAYRLGKFYRRHKVALAFTGALALTTLVGAGIATGQALRATKAERLAKRQEQLAIDQRELARKMAEREKALRMEAEQQRKRVESERQFAKGLLDTLLNTVNHRDVWAALVRDVDEVGLVSKSPSKEIVALNICIWLAEDDESLSEEERAKVVTKYRERMHSAANKLLSPPYVPAAELTSVDVRPWANRTLDKAGMAYTNLSDLRTGTTTFAGIAFKIENAFVQLGSERTLPEVTGRVEGIHIGSKARSLYFLHGTRFGTGQWPVDTGTLIGHYSVHFEDETIEHVPIAYGADVRDVWNADNSQPVTRGKLAWIGRNSVFGPWISVLLRLYVGSWRNPRPEKKISHIDYISANTNAAPFCIAITLEQSTGESSKDLDKERTTSTVAEDAAKANRSREEAERTTGPSDEAKSDTVTEVKK